MKKVPYDKYTKKIMDDINEISNDIFADIRNLDQYSDFISKQVLGILVQNACLGQNCAPVELGRKKIGEIANREWLLQHFMEVADENIDYSDEWEYRRLIELVILYIPELKEEVFSRGINSENKEVREIIEDFRELRNSCTTDA